MDRERTPMPSMFSIMLEVKERREKGLTAVLDADLTWEDALKKVEDLLLSIENKN